MDEKVIVVFIVGLLIGVVIHSYIKKERNKPNVLNLMILYWGHLYENIGVLLFILTTPFFQVF